MTLRQGVFLEYLVCSTSLMASLWRTRDLLKYYVNVTKSLVRDISPLMHMHQDPLLVSYCHHSELLQFKVSHRNSSQQESSHYCDAIMGAMASQIISTTIVYWAVYSGADQRKHQSSVPPAFCAGNSPVTSEFPAQMASSAENVSIGWRHHDEISSAVHNFLCHYPVAGK